MFGIDISNWQVGLGLTPHKDEFDFAICKLTEGRGFVDPMADKFLVQLTTLGKEIGLYHFARPDVNDTSIKMVAEADHFCDHFLKVKSQYNCYPIPFLDWEIQITTGKEKLLISAFMKQCQNRIGILPFLYCSYTLLSQYPDLTLYNIWFPQWPTNAKIDMSEAESFINMRKDETLYKGWIIWQFTSYGRFSGYPGNVDFDYTELTIDGWRRLAGVKDGESLSDEMKWAVEIGLFKGYKDGKYHPDDPLTRDQAAKLFYRFAHGDWT